MREQVDLSYYAAHPKICHLEATRLQVCVAAETIRNRGMRGLKQYGLLFGGMLAYGFKEPVRAALIRSAYAWDRDGDDIFDGDKLLPKGYKDKTEFSQIKRELIYRVAQPDSRPLYGDRVDILLVDYFSLARRLKIDLLEESLAIWDTMELDGERAAGRRVLTQQALDEYFNKLDFACIGGALKVAGEKCDSRDLSELSWAVRTMFNARDFPKDFAQGIINISREEMEQVGVDDPVELETQLQGRETVKQLLEYEPMRSWYEYHVPRGLDFLKKAQTALERLNLKWETRFALDRFFVQPTNKVLNQYAKMLVA
ncbi:hypothetical protein HYZ05_01485 [Candidatus Daviesbacteria bacterium]|nr:hypothetical protein [Candidatus Daviesbacteria bacterium]